MRIPRKLKKKVKKRFAARFNAKLSKIRVFGYDKATRQFGINIIK